MMTIKTIKLIVIFFLLIPLKSSAKFRTQNISLEGFNYCLYSSQPILKLDPVYNFHQLFKKNIYDLFSKYNVKRPASLNINIAYGAWIFKSLTGYTKNTAAVYSSEYEMFYFQRIDALRLKRILKETVQHEILHYIIDLERKKSKNNIDHGQLLWLEESYCESQFSTKKCKYPANKANLKKFTLSKFKNFLNTNLKSKNIKKQFQAYCLAKRWGIFLIKELGRKKYFLLLIKDRPLNNLNKLFIKFKLTAS